LRNADCSSQVNEVLFLEPVTLQLPINARLLEKLPRNDKRDSLIFWWKWFCRVQGDRALKAEAIDLRFIILAHHLMFGRAEEISYFFLPGNVDLSYQRVNGTQPLLAVTYLIKPDSRPLLFMP
jgi:hypothetical protein